MAKKPSRDYPRAVIVALVTLSGGACYAPDCGEPVIRMLDDKPLINAEIAHIRALSPRGPRFDPSWSSERRNSLENLLLLCSAHHDLIDGINRHEYPVELLERWKSTREDDGKGALVGLTRLTKEELSSIIDKAFEQAELRLSRKRRVILGAVSVLAIPVVAGVFAVINHSPSTGSPSATWSTSSPSAAGTASSSIRYKHEIWVPPGTNLNLDQLSATRGPWDIGIQSNSINNLSINNLGNQAVRIANEGGYVQNLDVCKQAIRDFGSDAAPILESGGNYCIKSRSGRYVYLHVIPLVDSPSNKVGLQIWMWN